MTTFEKVHAISWLILNTVDESASKLKKLEF